MSFAWPLALIALVAIPLLAFLYSRWERGRAAAAARWGNPALLPNLIPASPGLRRHIPVAVLLAAIAALIVGVARPRASLSVRQRESTIVLAIDTSYSMAAPDVHPTRLAAAQSAASRFVDQLPKDVSVALVSFGTGARAVVQPTTDRKLVHAGIAALQPGEGTALGDAIGVSLRLGHASQKNHPPLAILMLSDGAQTQGRLTPAAAAARARARSVPVYTVALGTQNGVVERPLAGGYKERIAVPPDPTTLHRIAEATGADFFTAPDAKQLRTVYDHLASRLGHKRERREVSAAFAGAGAVLLLVAGALSLFWFRRAPV